MRTAGATLCAERIELWADGCMIGRAGIVIADTGLPEVVMVDGLPFIFDPNLGPLAYRRVRPYCISTLR